MANEIRRVLEVVQLCPDPAAQRVLAMLKATRCFTMPWAVRPSSAQS